MTEALLVAAVLAAGLACPVMMWIQSRRGRSAPCCPPHRESVAPATLEELRARHARIAQELAELESAGEDREAHRPVALRTR